ncbi:hypothetical protein [Nocardiopsis aegyptia]|uniref:Uncharacterized protein n=1 Tax=Nocardiopsis aegyptia TaxID=220378 RepID=A0A7Z0EK24_9ACTN|nr:hypothetical protein [Nocardiopsis aegyptia]NYJ33051.1 hypothetical protein [Nocardiopsis aegyptia]
MSYKPAVVALRRDRSKSLENQLDRVMRPFLYHPDTESDGIHERHSRCDGWMVGGHWSGRYLSTAHGSADLVNPRRFPQDSPLAEYAACDGGPKHLLALERMRAVAEETAWRHWPAFIAERRRDHPLFGPVNDEPVSSIRSAFDEFVARDRDRAVTGTSLVTLEGQWLDGRGAMEESDAYYRRAGAYIDALDEGVWLVCLSVHF